MSSPKVTISFDAESLRFFCQHLLTALGTPEAHARIVGDSLVAANLRGVDSHGIRMISVYIQQLRAGGINVPAAGRVVSEDGVFLRYHGENGLGQVVTERCTDHAVQEGAIGQIQAALLSMPMYAGTIKAGGFGGNWAWWNDPSSLGHLINSAPHALDILRWFTGGDIVTVSAFSRTLLPDLPVEETTMALFELSTGAICSLFSSRALPAPSFPGEDFRIRIVGSKGLLDLDPYGELKLSDEQGWRLVSQQPPVKHEGADTAFADVRMQTYCDQMQAFISAIEDRPSQVGTGEDGRAAVAAVVAMLKSSADQCWISPGKVK